MNKFNLEKKTINEILIENVGLWKEISYETNNFNCKKIQDNTKKFYFATSFVAFLWAIIFLLVGIFPLNIEFTNFFIVFGVASFLLLSYLWIKMFNSIKTVNIDIVKEKVSNFLEKCKKYKVDQEVVQYILHQDMHLDKIDDLMLSLHYYDKYTLKLKE